jgi:transposase
VTHPADDRPAIDHDHQQVVLGVDTHADAHLAAVITVMGVLLGTKAFPATADGYAALLDWACGYRQLSRAGVEGTSSHGTALNRYLRRNDVQALRSTGPIGPPGADVAKPAHSMPRTRPEPCYRGRPPPSPKIAKDGDGSVEMIRLFKIAKNSAVKARTQAINQLKAVLVRAEPNLRHP